jgi:hypothetical protein
MPSPGSIFLFLAVLGGALVAFQALGSVIGLGHDAGDGDVSHLGEHDHDSALAAFNFKSIRAIATASTSGWRTRRSGPGGRSRVRQRSSKVARATLC